MVTPIIQTRESELLENTPMKQTSHPLSRPVVVCALLTMALSLRAADITWSNPSGGDWNTAANWDPSQVPGSADKAILGLAVTVTVNADATVGYLDLANGTLAGSGALTLSGTLTWTGGKMTGAGTTLIGSGGSLVISGSNAKTFTQRTIANAGTIVWSGATCGAG
jgi:phage baseplate assembly protein gpV